MSTQSSYRNWVGVRAVTKDTVTKTAVAAAATTVHVVTPTSITTSSTIVILDGAYTEVRAVSAVTSTALTVTALTYAHPKGAYVVAWPTSGFGPKGYLPLKTFKVPDKYDQLYDEARVGSLVDQRGVVQGMREAQWTFGGDVFADAVGWALAGIFGTEAYTAGTPTPPNTHVFGVKNTGNGQPVKHAYFVYDGVNCRLVVGRLTKVGLKFTPKQLASFTASLLARASGVVSTPTKSFSTIGPLPTWAATLNIATAYSRLPMSFEVTLSRSETENIPTMNGTQDPLDTFVGALTCKVKGTYVKTGDTQLSKYLKGTLQKFVLQLTRGTGATGVELKLQMSKANYDSVETVLQGKAYNTEAFAFTGIASSTDAGTSAGLSPCKVTLKNAVGTTIYL